MPITKASPVVTICFIESQSERKFGSTSKIAFNKRAGIQAKVAFHAQTATGKLNAEIIGFQNTKCEYCYEIKSSEKFRFNRLRCRDCERDEPIGKFKRCVRSRIYIALKKNKTKRTIKYLGCTNNEYFDWIMTYNENYNLENYGNVWHIDHVIPISKFNLDDEEEQTLAFNWRNTMPLSAQDNLKKGSKIINLQVAEHMEKLQELIRKNKECDFFWINSFA